MEKLQYAIQIRECVCIVSYEVHIKELSMEVEMVYSTKGGVILNAQGKLLLISDQHSGNKANFCLSLQ